MTTERLSAGDVTSLLIGFDPRFKDDDFTLPDAEVSIYQWLHESIQQSERISHGPVTDKYVHEALRQLRDIHRGAAILEVERIVTSAMKGNRRTAVSNNMPTLRRPKQPTRVIRSEVFTWKSLDTLPALPPDAVPGLPTSEVAVLGAAPGTGKSLLALLWAVAVATGRELPHGIIPHWPSGAPVLLVSLEETLLRIKYRLAAIAERYPDVRAGPIDNLHVTSRGAMRWAQVDSQEVENAVAVLAEHIAGIKPRLVVLDPIAQLEVVEDNETFNAFCKALSVVAQDHGCAIVLVHHFRKSAAGSIESTSMDRLRGGGALSAAVRVVHLLERQEDHSIRHWLDKANHTASHDDVYWTTAGISVRDQEIVCLVPHDQDAMLSDMPLPDQLRAVHTVLDQPPDKKLVAVQSTGAFLFTVGDALDMDAGPGQTMKPGPSGRTKEQKRNFRVLKNALAQWERRGWIEKKDTKIDASRKVKSCYLAGVDLPDIASAGPTADTSVLTGG